MEIITKTIEHDEEYLRQISAEVSLDDSNLESDIETLKRYFDKHSALAMAAIQLGIFEKINLY